MGYNKEAYAKVKAEYANKYARAQKQAEERRMELYAAIPDVMALDRILSGTGMDIMAIIVSGRADTEEAIRKLKERNRELEAQRDAVLTANGFPTDYSDVHYECPRCGDSGYVDGSMCDCMKQALALEGYACSGLGGLIGEQRFDNFSLSYYEGAAKERMQRNVKHLQGFADGFDRHTYRNYLLMGSTGLGKTHLSTAVAERVIRRGYDAFYVTAVGMLNDFESKRFGSDADRGRDLSRYYEADLLIVDDLGTELVNQFTLSCLYDVLNTRINNRRSTIINTNLPTKELEAKYNERITSRLVGEYLPLLFSGVDVRRQKISK
ncbi:MAG: ATP-binding protein [Clostridia bacterium]|nr:ATP-binding protein [Clostridia bacterium]